MKAGKSLLLMLALTLVMSMMVTALPVSAAAEGGSAGITLGAEKISVGNKVYFGKPILWRVLQSGDGKALLISDDVAGTAQFNSDSHDGNQWQGSRAQGWCSDYYNSQGDWPNAVEKNAILATTIVETNDQTEGDIEYCYKSRYYDKYNPGVLFGAASLSNEYFFFLSAKEVEEYFSDNDDRVPEAMSEYGCFWLRSPDLKNSGQAGIVNPNGWVLSNEVYDEWFTRPAFNLDLNAVLFTSEISSEPSFYKLTLKDENLSISKPEGTHAKRRDNVVTVPYSISGSNATADTGACVMITDRAYTDSGANVLQYTQLTAGAESGTGIFTMDSGISGTWGEDYHVYLLAVNESGEKKTDYASAPAELTEVRTLLYDASVTVGGETTNYTTFSEAVSAWVDAADGAALTLLESMTTGETISPNGNKTLELNGYRLRTSAQISVPSNSCITIQSSVPGGEIIGSDNAVIGAADGENIQAVLESGTIQAAAGNAFSFRGHATLNLNGGAIECTSSSRNMGTDSAVLLQGDGNTVNWNGTAITTNTGCGIHDQSAASTVRISSGSFSATGTDLWDIGYAVSNCNVELLGTPALNGNGIYLFQGQLIHIAEALPEYYRVYVTLSAEIGTFTSGLPGRGNADNFASPDSGCKITLSANGEAQLIPSQMRAPTARTLIYNGQEQVLADKGFSPGYQTMRYAVTTEDVAPEDASLYTIDVPAAINAGTYYLWYKVVFDYSGAETAPERIVAQIAPVDLVIEAMEQTVRNEDEAEQSPDLVSVSGLLDGDRLETVVLTAAEGSKSGVVNPSDAVIKNEADQDVTENYSITYLPGVLIKSYKVTFEVVNGAWDDGTTEDRIVMLTGADYYSLKLTEDQIPTGGSKPGKGYWTGKWRVSPTTWQIINGDITYTFRYEVPVFKFPKMVLPASTSTIEEEAFEGDEKLTSVDAHSCTLLKDGAFKNCTSLLQIRLPQNCVFEGNPFAGCGEVFVYAPAGGSTEAGCNEIENLNFIAE